MNILDLKTGEPFDPAPRLHHRDAGGVAVSSSEHSRRARGMLLAAKSFYIGGKKWVNPYDTEGLVAMWDGEWNAGGGVHESSPAKWSDLSGNGLDFALTEQTIGANFVGITNGNGLRIRRSQSITDTYLQSGYCIEAVFCYTTTGRVVSLGDRNDISIYRLSDRTCHVTCMGGFCGYGSTNTYYSYVLNAIQGQGVISNLAFVVDIENNKSRVYKNAQLVTTFNGAGVIGAQYSRSVFGICAGYETLNGCNGKFYNVRISSGNISDQVIQSRYLVDKARFNLS